MKVFHGPISALALVGLAGCAAAEKPASNEAHLDSASVAVGGLEYMAPLPNCRTAEW